LVSKSSLLPQIRAFDWRAVDAGLGERPDLIGYRDDRQRNWLHLLCMTPLGRRDPKDSVRTGDVLLARGIKLSEHAFTEGKWKATPVWHCVARGRNLALAEHLLRLGADPNYSFFAAAWNNDVEAIDLLARYCGDIEDRSNPFETPFIGAIAWSRLNGAEALARHGANVNAVDRKGRTALHILLKKGAEYKEIAKVVALGCRIDIADAAGRTAAQIMARKRDKRFRLLAET
jgi:uncharacterized protein